VYHRCFRHCAVERMTNRELVERVSHFSIMEQPD
jgi:hypothetical protein